MKRVIRAMLFASATVLLALAVFPVAAQAQVTPLGAGPSGPIANCGFTGRACAGGETFMGNIVPWFTAALTVFIALLGTVATIFIVYAAARYITSRGNEEAAASAKRTILYAIIGLIVAAGAGVIVAAIRPVPTAAPLIAFITPYITAFLGLIGTIAVIFIIYAGVKYITSAGDEQRANEAKNQVIYAVIGLIIASLAFIIVTTVTTLATAPLIVAVVNIINVFLGLVGIIAAIYLVYAGVKYISSGGDEQRAAEAKNQIIYAIIGVIITGIAFGIVNAVTTLNTIPLQATIITIVNAFLGLVAVVTGIYLVFAGIMYITSQGDVEASRKARMQIVYAVLGLVVIAVAATLVNFVIAAIP